jgi:hypothetical protein
LTSGLPSQPKFSRKRIVRDERTAAPDRKPNVAPVWRFALWSELAST